MYTVNIILLTILIATAVLGSLLGFGRSLKLTTKGVLGIIISIIVCVIFGRVVKSIPVVRGFVENIDAHFADLWSFLSKIYFGTVVYYICFFIVVQIIRIVVVKIICKIDDAKNKGMKAASKVLGAVFLSCFCFSLCLLCLAVLKIFESTELVIKILAKIEDSFLFTLYIHNPMAL